MRIGAKSIGRVITAVAVATCCVLTATSAEAAVSTSAEDCGSDTEGHLFCGNQGGVDLMSLPSYEVPPSRYVDTLETTFSRFECWNTGDWHTGGNRIWYKAKGDIFGREGYVAAAYVWTSTDPYPGVKHC